VENVVEVESADAILLVFSDGATWSLFENAECQMIAREASKELLNNLVGGQLLSLSSNFLLNLRSDKASELYRYVDKKLTMVGREKMKLASVA